MASNDLERFWDAELEALTALAESVHGEQVVVDVVDRTIRAFGTSANPVSAADFRIAMKTALRALVTPH